MGGWLTPGKVVSYYARSLLSLLPMPLTSMLTCTNKSLTAQAWVYCFRISNSRATTPVKLGTKVLRNWLISVNLRVMIPLVCVYAWILICIFFVWQWHKLIVFRQKQGKISCMCEESFLDWSNIFTCQKFYWNTSEAWIFTLQSHNIRWNLQVSV